MTLTSVIDNEGKKEIVCQNPMGSNGYPYTIWDYVKEHQPDLMPEWLHLHHEHNQMVQTAIANNHAVLVNPDDRQVYRIEWQSQEIHQEYCRTISVERNNRYLEFWQMFANFVDQNFPKKNPA